MANNKVYKEFGVKIEENISEFFEIGADAKNVFIQNAERTQYGDADGIVDLQTKLDNFNKSIRNIGSGVATEVYAAAFGQSTKANGQSSHAEGCLTIASGSKSHAEGYLTSAEGEHAHSEGERTAAFGKNSHAEGYCTTAEGDYSHAEGGNTIAKGEDSHAEGYSTVAKGNYSHAEGYCTTAEGHFSHTEGFVTIAQGAYSHAEGYKTTVEGDYSHAEGYGTVAKGLHSHVEGLNNQEQGNTNHMEGDENILQGNLNHVEGFSNNIIGDGLHIEGCGNITYLEPQTQVYFASLPRSITAHGDDVAFMDNKNVITLAQEENIDGRLYKYMMSAKISIPSIAQSSSSSLEELVNSSIWRGSCVIPRDSSSHPYTIFKKHDALGSGTYIFKIYFQTYPNYEYIEYASFNIKEVQKIRTISEKQQFDIGSHIQGKYCTVQSNLAHIVGGGSSNDDRKNIHTLDWDGNAEFAGDVTLFGCGGSNPIQLSTLTKGPLIIQESMIEEYSGQGEYGDKILDAIQKNRQILILLTNQGGSPYSLYSPVITYHLPHEANTELSLFYLPDGMSPTNFNIKEAQFKVSNPITFNDNLKN